MRAREIRWRRDPAIGDPRAALLRRIDGLEVDQRPESGMFVGDRFVHPALGFTVRFPSGWRKQNTNRAVGAVEPRGEAVVFLPRIRRRARSEVARGLDRKEEETVRLKVHERGR